MARLVIVSNRVSLPNEPAARAGGLAVALRDALAERGGLWFGWSGRIVEASADVKPTLLARDSVNYATLDLAADEHRHFYLNYANDTLWPLLHYRLGLLRYRRSARDGYLRVNERFATALLPLLRPDDRIWVHDYHFFPLAAALRRLGATQKIGFFLHTPFPTAGVLIALPGHEALVEAMFAYDLLGFQTQDDVNALQEYVRGVAGGVITHNGSLIAFGRRTRAAAVPIGIDPDAWARTAERAERSPESLRLRASLGDRQLIIGVDRLDYSKGLAERFEAFRALLSRWPEHRRRVTYMQIAALSRVELAQYRTIRRELDVLAGGINGEFSEFDWVPMRYLNRSFAQRTLAGFYRLSRIGLVTPMRDGMNLVVKEFVASQPPDDPGIPVLSQFAGAARELDAALIVNPLDRDAIAEAIDAGLRMPVEERRERWQAMMAVLRRNTIFHWSQHYLALMNEVEAGVDA